MCPEDRTKDDYIYLLSTTIAMVLFSYLLLYKDGHNILEYEYYVEARAVLLFFCGKGTYI